MYIIYSPWNQSPVGWVGCQKHIVWWRRPSVAEASVFPWSWGPGSPNSSWSQSRKWTQPQEHRNARMGVMAGMGKRWRRGWRKCWKLKLPKRRVSSLDREWLREQKRSKLELLSFPFFPCGSPCPFGLVWSCALPSTDMLCEWLSSLLYLTTGVITRNMSSLCNESPLPTIRLCKMSPWSVCMCLHGRKWFVCGGSDLTSKSTNEMLGAPRGR